MYIRGESANMKRESERNEEKVLSGGSHAILRTTASGLSRRGSYHVTSRREQL